MYGMRLSQLTPELVDEILDLYGNIAMIPKDKMFWRRTQNGWDGTYHVQEISEQLKYCNVAEWRYGSGLSGVSGQHAKFLVWQATPVNLEDEREKIIRFAFDPNVNVVEGDEEYTVKESFRLAVEKLLQERGLAIKLIR